MESESLETVGFMQSTFEDVHLQSLLKTKPESSRYLLEQLKGSNIQASDSKAIQVQRVSIEEEKGLAAYKTGSDTSEQCEVKTDLKEQTPSATLLRFPQGPEKGGTEPRAVEQESSHQTPSKPPLQASTSRSIAEERKSARHQKVPERKKSTVAPSLEDCSLSLTLLS